jgi:hypothetical protein
MGWPLGLGPLGLLYHYHHLPDQRTPQIPNRQSPGRRPWSVLHRCRCPVLSCTAGLIPCSPWWRAAPKRLQNELTPLVVSLFFTSSLLSYGTATPYWLFLIWVALHRGWLVILVVAPIGRLEIIDLHHYHELNDLKRVIRIEDVTLRWEATVALYNAVVPG